MNKTFPYSVVFGLCSVLLTACQSTHNVADTLRIKNYDAPVEAMNAAIYCGGVKYCEFERINSTPVMDSKKHRVSPESLREGIIRLQGSVFSAQTALYLSVPNGQHELVIRFYPISLDRSETFHVIHQFKPNKRYTFKMYRDRAQRKNSSLLSVSQPEPLCVALEEEQQVIRRFCRPFDAVTGLGEFIERKV